MSYRSGWIAKGWIAMAGVIAAPAMQAQSYNLSEYRAAPGLTAESAQKTLTVTWDGERNEEIRLRLALQNGTPVIQEIALRHKGGTWAALAANLEPEFHIVSGLRRMTDQQLLPLKGLGIKITPEILNQDRWEAFWDAPLNVPGMEAAHHGATPPAEGIANQPGLPRKAEEIRRSSAKYDVQSGSVKTDGGRLEISYPGVQLGVFSGALQYTVYKGSNLIRQEVIAKTEQPAVAYKYEAGVKGMTIAAGSRVIWRDTANFWQESEFRGAVNRNPVTLQAANRIVAAEGKGGSIAAFPPVHNFFWAREIDFNLGYNWYRKDSDSSFSLGVRQPDGESDPADAGRGPEDRRQNFALRSARPGTSQRMPLYLYVSSASARTTVESALAYTRQDRFKPLAGYEVMATHFHAGLVRRLLLSGGLDNVLPDFAAMKSAGVTVFAPIDGGGVGMVVPGGATPRGRLETLADYYQVARLHSDKNFLVMPNEEIFGGPPTEGFGGHHDLLLSHPVYWTQTRAVGQAFVEDDRKYGKIYHVGSPADLIEMAHRENLILYMPHPRSKGSTGYPDATKDTPTFRDASYRGVGFRWGMGLDGSERRLCEYRCMPLFDDMNNWVADLPTPPKYMQAISEVYQQGTGDDIYANNPVNYVKVDTPPGIDNWKPIIDSMKRGDYFVTSGEVLIPSWSVQGTGSQRTIVADVEWTFPLEFAEVVWGDGQRTGRQIIAATDLPPFGKHSFQIPFNADGKKWVRFAVWDSAGEGAFVQPVKLPSANSATAPAGAH
ncbi:MAG TPA: hypothetical protein VNY05_06620 [Candidatus Acidoferrales bacterium]|nr:hypothetical protein [Candidatus Acidoferrales bacterium]